jgi:hypothetical protein
VAHTSSGACYLIPAQTRLSPGLLILNTIISTYSESNPALMLGKTDLGQFVFWLCYGQLAIATAYGSWCKLLFRRHGYTFVLVPSGALKAIPDSTACSPFLRDQTQFLALTRGAKELRARRKRPSVRGTVMNPNDHPHGGRTRAIGHPKTP